MTIEAQVPVPAGPGRRERKKLATRQALLDAALRLAAERGFEQVTVEDISEAADVAPRTFFNYFSSKEEALLGNLPEKATAISLSVADRPAGESPLEAVSHVLRTMTLELAERRDELLLRQQIVERHPALLARQLGMQAAFERILADAVAERIDPDAGDPRARLYAKVVAAAATGAVRTAVSSWMAGQGREPIADLIDAAFEHLRHLGVPPGSGPAA